MIQLYTKPAGPQNEFSFILNCIHNRLSLLNSKSSALVWFHKNLNPKIPLTPMRTIFPPVSELAMRIPYALRHVPGDRFASMLPVSAAPRSGDIALAKLEKIGKNTRLELADGRAANLHEGDTLAVVFGNRYATRQFE